MTLPPNLRDRILQEAAVAPSPTRTATTHRNRIILALGLLGTLGLWLAIGGLVVGERTLAYGLVLLGPLTVALGGAGYVVLRKRVDAPSAAACMGVTCMLLVALPLGVAGGHALQLDAGFASGPRHDVMCALLGSALGLPPAASLVWVYRHQLAIRGAYLAALVGAVGFGLGGLAMVLRCTCVESVHMVLGHLLPPLVMTAMVAWLGRWLLLRFADRHSA